MALIKCPECGREISDRAEACIHCGCPIEKASAEVFEPHKEEECKEKTMETVTEAEKEEKTTVLSKSDEQNVEENAAVSSECEVHEAVDVTTKENAVFNSSYTYEQNAETSENLKKNHNKKEKDPIWKRTWFVILMLIFLFPVGVFLVWKYKKFKKPIRIACYVILGLYFLVVFMPCIHEWEEATCENAKICTKCGTVEGEALGHEWEEATCQAPETCARCNETQGKALEHEVEEWTTDTESTCAEEGSKSGKCLLCNEVVTASIEKIEHTEGEWVITKAATSSANGERSKSCTACGTVLQTEEYEMSAAEIKAEYIKNCKSYTYNEIARNPESYKGYFAKFTGEVIQVMEDGDEYTLRVDITKGKYGWDDTILVAYEKQDSSEPRILEDDVITMYGMLWGTHTYETVLGASVTIPLFFAEYIDF